MQLKVKALTSSEHAKLTTSPEDTGYDLYVVEQTTIAPGETKLIKHGIAIELSPGFASVTRSRSSSLTKRGLFVNPGTIDNGYRGELMSQVENHGTQPVTLEPGERVSQLVVEQVFKPEVIVVSELSDTQRGAGGFGSTGV